MIKIITPFTPLLFEPIPFLFTFMIENSKWNLILIGTTKCELLVNFDRHSYINLSWHPSDKLMIAEINNKLYQRNKYWWGATQWKNCVSNLCRNDRNVFDRPGSVSLIRWQNFNGIWQNIQNRKSASSADTHLLSDNKYENRPYPENASHLRLIEK